ncbi:isocitrate lyase/phosphoenolpyruvate mutase family protein [Streptomyces sp. NPDC059169]|uniref:isocitrate lyase/phosphoenolpyruvate mutase family protein n=1 Tax=Streptomyces sp. NPDC059169 TaxID=3346754 RepID=UPI0036CE4DF9
MLEPCGDREVSDALLTDVTVIEPHGIAQTADADLIDFDASCIALVLDIVQCGNLTRGESSAIRPTRKRLKHFLSLSDTQESFPIALPLALLGRGFPTGTTSDWSSSLPPGTTDGLVQRWRTLPPKEGTPQPGADGIFVPGVTDTATSAALAKGISVPLNVMAVPGAPTVAELGALWVARVSLGSGVAQSAYADDRHRAVHEPGHRGRTHGPRTTEQLRSTLKGASVVLDDAVLDRIDEIVPPGTDVYPPDGVWSPPSLTTPALRRRAVGSRSAA